MIELHLPDADDAHYVWEHTVPFPHIVLPDAVDREAAAAIGDEFPQLEDPRWHTFRGRLESGKQEGQAAIAGPLVAEAHALLAAPWFIEWLRIVSGVADLIADPLRTGGGIHQSGPNARLGLHCDFDCHPHDQALMRAVNLILFVGDVDWDPKWGGNLLLGEGGQLTVPPNPGTLIVFQYGRENWHGHPEPMAHNAPRRRSIPTYYYRPRTADDSVWPVSTEFLDERP